jgi:hypothetical protein
MFERPLRWWLRLYPLEFREHYGEEMLYVIRDRVNESDDRFGRLCVCIRFVYDLVASLPKIYFHDRQKLVSLSSGSPVEFRLVEEARPSQWIVIVSTVLSLLLLQCVRSLHPCPNASEGWTEQIRSFCQATLHFLR